MKVAEAALVLLREQGVRILNYLDDWLIQAQSQHQLCEHRDLVLLHLSQLGLRVNWEKSKLSLMQRISFSVWSWIRSIRQRASRRNVLSWCWTTWIRSRAGRGHHWNSFRGSWGIWRLLHIRPLQHWLHSRVPRWAWQHGMLWVRVTPACRQTFRLWFTRMPLPRAGGPRSTGLQFLGFGRVPNCTGTSAA